MSILAPRKYSHDDEARLAARLEEMLTHVLTVVDSAVRLRTAPSESKRMRQIMKNKLQEAGMAGLDAMAHSLNKGD